MSSVNWISPYISEGSGLKRMTAAAELLVAAISPYISEGSGLKLRSGRTKIGMGTSPLTSVRGAD